MHRGEVLRSVVSSCRAAAGDRPDRAPGHVRDVHPRRRHLGRRQQRLAARRRRGGAGHRRPARRRRDRGRRRRPAGGRHRLHPRPRRPRRRRARAAPSGTGAPVLLHPDDRVLWRLAHADAEPGRRAAPTGSGSRSPGTCVQVLHTPGHAPGGGVLPRCRSSARSSAATRCSPAARARPAGRTATSRRSSSRSAAGCCRLPPDTVVHTGHGGHTTIGAESPHLQEWIDRGH